MVSRVPGMGDLLGGKLSIIERRRGGQREREREFLKKIEGWRG